MKRVRNALLNLILLAGAATIAAGLYAETHRVPDQP
jgi:hypothetical protein